jgi:hypothetical protein
VRTAVRTEAEWNQTLLHVVDKLVKVLPGIGDQPKNLGWYGMGALFAVTAYPKAQEQLKEAGYTETQIKAMCSAQAILTAEVETFEHLNNYIFKWFYADTPEALRGLNDAEHEIEKVGRGKKEIIPLAAVLLPALSKVKALDVEADRHVAALRVVEALRLYAAQHNQLPTQLNEIQEVPVPNDPTTGQPFAYHLAGKTATLSSAPPPGRPAPEGLKWTIELAPGKK